MRDAIVVNIDGVLSSPWRKREGKYEMNKVNARIKWLLDAIRFSVLSIAIIMVAEPIDVESSEDYPMLIKKWLDDNHVPYNELYITSSLSEALDCMEEGGYSPIMIFENDAFVSTQYERQGLDSRMILSYSSTGDKNVKFITNNSTRGIEANAGSSDKAPKDYTDIVEAIGRFMIDNKKILAKGIKVARYFERIASKVKSKK